jgi:hypothetical protein
MKTRALAITTVAVGALTGAALGLAGAAAPSTVGSAAGAVTSLEAEGYKVILTKLGGDPLHKCTMTAVRPGRDVTHLITVPGSDATIEQLRYTTGYVDARC